MHRNRLLNISAVLVLASVVSACSLSPGLYMGKPDDVNKVLQEGIPQSALIPITPSLIAQQKQASTADLEAEVRFLYGSGSVYKLGAGDIVNIVVWGHPELDLAPVVSSRSLGSTTQSDIGNGYPISADGHIQFPLVGVVKAAGMTDLALRDLLMQKLSAYIVDPQLTVRVQSYRNSRVYVDGEVGQPGLQVMDDLPMTLPEVVSRAGGYTPEADRSSVVVSRNGINIRVNVAALARTGVNPNQIMLFNGDLIRVLHQIDTQVYVMGEVTRPQPAPLRDGVLSLADALGNSGGLDPLTADASQVYILRSNAQLEPKIYHLDVGSPIAHILANDFPLQAKDIVYVDPAPVVRWNRVIRNLLPSASTLLSTQRSFF